MAAVTRVARDLTLTGGPSATPAASTGPPAMAFTTLVLAGSVKCFSAGSDRTSAFTTSRPTVALGCDREPPAPAADLG